VIGKSIALSGALIAANIAVWLWALWSFHAAPALLATAVLAYVLGLRHAVDADHIAAIDNVTRKLIGCLDDRFEGGADIAVAFGLVAGERTGIAPQERKVRRELLTKRHELCILHQVRGPLSSPAGGISIDSVTRRSPSPDFASWVEQSRCSLVSSSGPRGWLSRRRVLALGVVITIRGNGHIVHSSGCPDIFPDP